MITIKNYIVPVFALLVVLTSITSCEKNTLRSSETFLAEDKAYTKFYFLSPGTPAVMIKVNDVKINGTNTSGSAGVFPSTITFPDYAATVPGGNIKMALPNIGTGNDSVVIFTGTLPTKAGKFHSVTLADTGIDRTLFTVEDNSGNLPDSGFYYVRFINAVAKSPNISLIRIDSANASTVVRDTIIKDIPFKSASSYVRVPISAVNSFYRYRMIISATGASFGSNMLPSQANSINQRYATIYGSGFVNGTGIYSPIVQPLVLNK
jgi:hypothetical protein